MSSHKQSSNPTSSGDEHGNTNKIEPQVLPMDKLFMLAVAYTANDGNLSLDDYKALFADDCDSPDEECDRGPLYYPPSPCPGEEPQSPYYPICYSEEDSMESPLPVPDSPPPGEYSDEEECELGDPCLYCAETFEDKRRAVQTSGHKPLRSYPCARYMRKRKTANKRKAETPKASPKRKVSKNAYVLRNRTVH